MAPTPKWGTEIFGTAGVRWVTAPKISVPSSAACGLKSFVPSDSGCGTVHANAAADVPARLEALGTTAGLDRAALHSQLAAALDVIVHLVRGRDGRRRIAQIHVLERDAAGLVTTVPAAVWDGPGAAREHGAATVGFVRERGWERLRRLCLSRSPGHGDGTGGSPGGPAAGTGSPCRAQPEQRQAGGAVGSGG